MNYAKYHAIGNNYLVISPAALPGGLSADSIRLICHRHFGVGSDGILLGPLASASCQFGLKVSSGEFGLLGKDTPAGKATPKGAGNQINETVT